jgi:uncharacterized protein (TIGR00255 family)
MTGFGAASAEAEGFRVVVTARSLNHRFFELGVHSPRRLMALEPEVKRLVQSRVTRGRVEVSIQAEAAAEERRVVVGPTAFVGSAVDALKRIQREFALPGDVRVSDVAHLPGVVEVLESADGGGEERRRELLGVVGQALDGLMEMRRAEGRHLEETLRQLLAALEGAALRLEDGLAAEKPARREALLDKLRALREELGLEDGRLYQEVVRSVERTDVAEELQRLRSHVAQARAALEADGPCGKRLDFLAQEMAREASTIGSKTASATLGHEVVSLKGDVERFREQVQNVE